VNIRIGYSTIKPDNHPECRVNLHCSLKSPDPASSGPVVILNEGEGTEVKVKVHNVSAEPLPMVIAQIRLPGGLEPRFEKLKELVKSEKIDYYEIFGAREIVLYWRGMHAKGEVEVSFDGVAVVPGTYTGRSSCVYLYYTPEQVYWVDGLRTEIKKSEKKEHVPSVEEVTAPVATQQQEDPVPVVRDVHLSPEEDRLSTPPTTPVVPDYDPYADTTLSIDIAGETPVDDLSAFGGGSSFGGFVGF